MKSSIVACLAVLAFQASVVCASEMEGALVCPLPNGDVELENVGPAFASQRKIIELNTNANYRVACQVFYYDPDIPTEDAEIEQKDKFVNQALELYLENVCVDLSAEELADAYRSGDISRYLDGFRLWMKVNMSDLCVDVVGVSMKATGALRRRVSE